MISYSVLLLSRNLCRTYVHHPTRNETSLYKLVWILSHNLAIFTGPWLTLIRIHNQIPRLSIVVPALEVHKTPFHARRKPGSSSSSQAGRFDFADQPVMRLLENLLRLVPVAVLHGGLEVRTMVAIEIGEDTVLVLKAA